MERYITPQGIIVISSVMLDGFGELVQVRKPKSKKKRIRKKFFKNKNNWGFKRQALFDTIGKRVFVGSDYFEDFIKKIEN